MVFIVQLHDKSIRVNINDKTRLPSSHQITDPKSPQKAIRDAKLFSVCNTSSSMPDDGYRNIEIPAPIPTGTSILDTRVNTVAHKKLIVNAK
jgi:hypothetical protein